MAEVVEKLRAYVPGWKAYFRLSPTLIDSGWLVSHDLNFSNRPMPILKPNAVQCAQRRRLPVPNSPIRPIKIK